MSDLASRLPLADVIPGGGLHHEVVVVWRLNR